MPPIHAQLLTSTFHFGRIAALCVPVLWPISM